MSLQSPVALQPRYQLNREFRLLIASVAFLSVIGWIFLTSASSGLAARTAGDSWFFSTRQGFFLLLGALLAWGASRIQVKWVRASASLVLLFALATLVLVLKIGKEVGGQKNWIAITETVNFQPSEFAKLAMILFAAHWLWYCDKIGLSLRWRVGVLIGICLTLVGLVLLEGDFGTPVILFVIALGLLFIAHASWKLLAALMLIALTCGLLFISLGNAYRFKRIAAWWNPEAYAASDSWQLLHGQFAMADGGLLGRGFGQSTEKWGGLPAPHTDFILPVIAQELGVVGTALVLIPLFTLIAVAFLIARDARDQFERTVATGISLWLGTQTLVNLGGITGMLPITGVPLPFVSYGGSSLVPLLLAIGILLGIARHNSIEAGS